MADREAVARITGDTRGLSRALRSSRSELKSWATGIKNDIGRGLSGAFSGVAGLAGFGGAAMMVSAGKEALEFSKRLTYLGIQGEKSAEYMEALKQKIWAIAQAKGVDPSELLGGAEQWVTLTGRIDDAQTQLSMWAMTAAASGTSMSELAQTSAALSTNFGVAAVDMEKAFGILLQQGKAGAVELKEIASLAMELTPSFARFGVTGTKGLAEMGAMLQTMRSGFATSSQAATGMQALMTGLIRHSAKIKKLGKVDIFEKDKNGVKRLRSMKDITFELIDKVGKNPELVQQLLPDKEAGMAFNALMDQGQNSRLAQVEKLIDDANNAGTVIRTDYKKYMESAAGRLEVARIALKKQWDDVFSPERMLQLVAAAEKLVDVVRFLIDNKEAVLGSFLALKYLPGLGQAVFGGGGGGGGVAGAVAGGLGGGWSMVNPLPVMVVGGGVAGGAGGVAGAVGGGAAAAGKKSMLGRVAGVAGSVLGLAGAAYAGYQLGDYIQEATGLGDYIIGNAGAKMKHSDFMKYGAFAPRVAEQSFYGAEKPWEDVDVQLMKDAPQRRGPWAEGSAAKFYPDAGDMSYMDYVEKKRRGIDQGQAAAASVKEFTIRVIGELQTKDGFSMSASLENDPAYGRGPVL